MTALLIGLLGASLGAIGAFLAGRFQGAAAITAAREQAEATRQTSQRQIEASTILTSRQMWIDGVRQDLADFVACLLRLHMVLELQNEEARKQWTDELIRATMLESKIKLRLNPREGLHERLIQLIEEAANALRTGKRLPDWGVAANQIIEAGQVIFKTEWDRIRASAAGDPKSALVAGSGPLSLPPNSDS